MVCDHIKLKLILLVLWLHKQSNKKKNIIFMCLFLIYVQYKFFAYNMPVKNTTKIQKVLSVLCIKKVRSLTFSLLVKPTN